MYSLKLTDIKGVGEKRAQLFKKLGVTDVSALLYYFPRNYIDLSSPCSPADAAIGDTCAVVAEVLTPPVENRIRKGMTVYRFTAGADGVALKVTLFNQKYLAAKLHTGYQYIFYGNVTGSLFNKQMTSPEIIMSSKAYIRPIYSCCEGLSSAVIESTVKEALKYISYIEDPIPEYISTRYKLMSLSEAIKEMHFPTNAERLNTARRRMMFQELLLLQCGICCLSNATKENSSAVIKNFSEEFENILPFPLTDAQKRSIKEAMDDMVSGKTMNRLLQGDVGSGKTAVAASLSYSVIKSGYQAVLMAPTEILAEQHYLSLSKLFDGHGVKIALLTGSTKNKGTVTEGIKSGEYDLIIGTHALLENNVEFNNLQFVITDEQHRFGVEQRSRLISKGNSPHILVMSATPIPRTLALMIYGDLEISVLDQLPPGRKPIMTKHVKSEKKDDVYGFVKKQIDSGRQAYIVCPLVESNESDLVPATEYYDQLSKTVFSGYKVALLHGRMRPSEKESVMRAFHSGEYDILVSTTVIEVGVDVPNATIMIIENAERFGLSQLHQLRGRVGRSSHKSYCILISDAQNEVSLGRINELCSTNDGFKIAEYDLKSRGPGDFFGKRQHGLPPLKLADYITDAKAIAFAQNIAKQICTDDPDLEFKEHKALKNAVDSLFRDAGGFLN